MKEFTISDVIFRQDLEKLIKKYKYGLFLQEEVEEDGVISDIYKGVIDDLVELMLGHPARR